MPSTEMSWRKFNRSIVRDEDFDYISDSLSPELKAAPYMFYMVALCKADDDGIFDLEDGIIFSRLMRIGTPRDVFHIADLMFKRKILVRAGQTSKCMFTSWEYSSREKPRTIEDRRKVVSKMIDEEQRSASNFFCNENDKNCKNVTTENFDDKKEKTVAKTGAESNDREKERIDRQDIQERKDKRETHTQERKEDEKSKAKIFNDFGFDTGEPIDTAERTEQPQAEEKEDYYDDFLEVNTHTSETEGVGQDSELVLNDSQKATLKADIDAFFAKNYLGYSAQEFSAEVDKIATGFLSLSDEANPPEIVCSVMLQQFKNLSLQDGYFKNIPLTPRNFLKEGVMSHVIDLAGKILSGRIQAQKERKERQELKQNSESTHNEIEQTFVRYNIDPNDPDRIGKLMRAIRKK